MKERGKLIVLEGGVGAGKTTIVDGLKKELTDWQFFREPGGTPYGERVRDAVQGNYGYTVEKYASFFGYTASRANLVRGEIIPLLESGRNVVLDRYWYSSFAYQGSEGVSKLFIWAVSLVATKNEKPKLVLHYDLNPEIGKQRKQGSSDMDRYDRRDIKYHQAVRRSYRQLSRLYPGIWHTIDASQAPEAVLAETISIVKKHGLL